MHQRFIGGGGPVQIGTWLAGGELELARLARRQLQRFLRVARMAMQAVDSGRTADRLLRLGADTSVRNLRARPRRDYFIPFVP